MNPRNTTICCHFTSNFTTSEIVCQRQLQHLPDAVTSLHWLHMASLDPRNNFFDRDTFHILTWPRKSGTATPFLRQALSINSALRTKQALSFSRFNLCSSRCSKTRRCCIFGKQVENYAPANCLQGINYMRLLYLMPLPASTMPLYLTSRPPCL